MSDTMSGYTVEQIEGEFAVIIRLDGNEIARMKYDKLPAFYCFLHGERRQLQAELERVKGERDKYKAWYEAVSECAVVSWSGWDETDPLKTVRELVSWNNTVALDPAVSGEAAALRDTYKAERDQLAQAVADAEVVIAKIAEPTERYRFGSTTRAALDRFRNRKGGAK